MDGKEELKIIEEVKQGACIMRLEGEITRVTGEGLLKRRDWEKGLPGESRCLIVDFSRVSYINSAGIAALIRLFRLGSGSYRSLGIGLHYHYEKLFNMVGLNRYLTLVSSEWAALEEATRQQLL